MNPPLLPAVDAYLNAATRLLPPRTRHHARAELHANLHQAMLDHLTAGMPAADAWAAALRDFGPAWLAALGLARTHTLPLLLRLGLAAGVLGGAASALWPHHLEVPPAQEARLHKLWREWGSPIVFALLFTQFGATAVKVDGASMMPALRSGEWLAVPKVEGWAHRAGLGAYQRGEVVVFKPPRAAAFEWTHDYRGLTLPWAYRPYLVKRVVALPGDRVRMNRGELYVNGQRVEESWTLPFWQGLCHDRDRPLANSVAASPTRPGQTEITVPAGHYFVMGDNRSPGGSLDSRVFGPVGVGDIAGRAVASFWPLAQREQATPPCDGQAHPEQRVVFEGKTRWNPRWLAPPAAWNALP